MDLQRRISSNDIFQRRRFHLARTRTTSYHLIETIKAHGGRLNADAESADYILVGDSTSRCVDLTHHEPPAPSSQWRDWTTADFVWAFAEIEDAGGAPLYESTKRVVMRDWIWTCAEAKRLVSTDPYEMYGVQSELSRYVAAPPTRSTPPPRMLPPRVAPVAPSNALARPSDGALLNQTKPIVPMIANGTISAQPEPIAPPSVAKPVVNRQLSSSYVPRNPQHLASTVQVTSTAFLNNVGPVSASTPAAPSISAPPLDRASHWSPPRTGTSASPQTPIDPDRLSVEQNVHIFASGGTEEGLALSTTAADCPKIHVGLAGSRQVPTMAREQDANTTENPPTVPAVIPAPLAERWKSIEGVIANTGGIDPHVAGVEVVVVRDAQRPDTASTVLQVDSLAHEKLTEEVLQLVMDAPAATETTDYQRGRMNRQANVPYINTDVSSSPPSLSQPTPPPTSRPGNGPRLLKRKTEADRQAHTLSMPVSMGEADLFSEDGHGHKRSRSARVSTGDMTSSRIDPPPWSPAQSETPNKSTSRFTLSRTPRPSVMTPETSSVSEPYFSKFGVPHTFHVLCLGPLRVKMTLLIESIRGGEIAPIDQATYLILDEEPGRAGLYNEHLHIASTQTFGKKWRMAVSHEWIDRCANIGTMVDPRSYQITFNSGAGRMITPLSPPRVQSEGTSYADVIYVHDDDDDDANELDDFDMISPPEQSKPEPKGVEDIKPDFDDARLKREESFGDDSCLEETYPAGDDLARMEESDTIYYVVSDDEEDDDDETDDDQEDDDDDEEASELGVGERSRRNDSEDELEDDEEEEDSIYADSPNPKPRGSRPRILQPIYKDKSSTKSKSKRHPWTARGENKQQWDVISELDKEQYEFLLNRLRQWLSRGDHNAGVRNFCWHLDDEGHEPKWRISFVSIYNRYRRQYAAAIPELPYKPKPKMSGKRRRRVLERRE